LGEAARWGWSFKKVGGVGVDSHDNVYVFNRAPINPQALTTMRRCPAGSNISSITPKSVQQAIAGLGVHGQFSSCCFNARSEPASLT
jgi:hypothetical protein